jgi:hypothetical protein
LHSPASLTASLTLEIQWDRGLELQGFESPELERSEEKGSEELGVPRERRFICIELCRA